MEQRLGGVRLGDGTVVRFAVTGEGPPLVYVSGWLSHLELSWALPVERRFYEALSAGRTLVRYDRPGCGLSDAAGQTDVVQLELEVLAAITGAVGVDRFDLMGVSFGAPLAARWAAQHPDTVSRLILYGGWVDGQQIASPGVREQMLALIEQHWGLGSELLTNVFAPDADAGFRALSARYQRESSPPETARRLLAASYGIDVSDCLGDIRAATSVIHREHDRAAPLAQGRALADGIPAATFTVQPGRTHLPYLGDADALVNQIRGDLGLPLLRRRGPAVLTSRQLEVAALVAAGLSNREIGERLVITERSAESHVERIRARLGFRSRAQIAAWHVATSAHN